MTALVLVMIVMLNFVLLVKVMQPTVLLVLTTQEVQLQVVNVLTDTGIMVKPSVMFVINNVLLVILHHGTVKSVQTDMSSKLEQPTVFVHLDNILMKLTTVMTVHTNAQNVQIVLASVLNALIILTEYYMIVTAKIIIMTTEP
jgi:hypothetical protein